MPVPSLSHIKKKSRRIRPAGKYAEVKIIPQPQERRASQLKNLDADLPDESASKKKTPASKPKPKS